ncbi:hypothetical protein [Sporosarcina sp. NPDC096371]|uniref:hypothetical protein n=1 Tax=Sporosarcina sp. NPDC096371 TaxID=3364530 RepID=UPI0037F1482D
MAHRVQLLLIERMRYHYREVLMCVGMRIHRVSTHFYSHRMVVFDPLLYKGIKAEVPMLLEKNE